MSHTCFHPRRQARRERALARQEKYDQLTLTEKLDQQEPFHGKQWYRLDRLRCSPPLQNSEENTTNTTRLTAEEKAARKAATKVAKQAVQ